MHNSIYECYDGTFIDLSKILAISHHSYDSIKINFQLLKEPIFLERWKKDGTSLLDKGGNNFEPNLFKIELENLIKVWSDYKNKNHE
jgi:hypothetical protein